MFLWINRVTRSNFLWIHEFTLMRRGEMDVWSVVEWFHCYCFGVGLTMETWSRWGDREERDSCLNWNVLKYFRGISACCWNTWRVETALLCSRTSVGRSLSTWPGMIITHVCLHNMCLFGCCSAILHQRDLPLLPRLVWDTVTRQLFKLHGGVRTNAPVQWGGGDSEGMRAEENFVCL